MLSRGPGLRGAGVLAAVCALLTAQKKPPAGRRRYQSALEIFLKSMLLAVSRP
jgi:hypothetical protein